MAPPSSSHSNRKQGVANVTRRTWDLETYEKRAKERQLQLEQADLGQSTTTGNDTTTVPLVASGDGNEKEEFQAAPSGAAGPEGSDRAFLKTRSRNVQDIDSKIGTTEVISAEQATVSKAGTAPDAKTSTGTRASITDGVVKTGVGWHCKICDCFLKDSHTYLDHINGRKHQRKLGYSMRVERCTKEDLLAKLEVMKEKEEKVKELDLEEDFNELVKHKDEELIKRRLERKRRRKAKRREQQQLDGQINQSELETGRNDQKEEVDQENQEETTEDEPNTDLAAIMGFSGFGTSKS